ncbi:hypothetical protein NDU88_000014 [Pleurodeles waltl]|uniref:Uncharacterized protein n=1 Tax=Pleurodeles waltl TaxID=8319 RepID=A0AAV7WHQ7_PLEWA|nr:hypothetical protein NDU88_000014 [Pleurodeles waltl]
MYFRVSGGGGSTGGAGRRRESTAVHGGEKISWVCTDVMYHRHQLWSQQPGPPKDKKELVIGLCRLMCPPVHCKRDVNRNLQMCRSVTVWNLSL